MIGSKCVADRMNRTSAMSVCEIQDGQYILPGHVYIAPGDRHLLIERDGARYRGRLSDGPPVNRHRPSVEVLFRSTAQAAGPHAAGVIMTGMGDDGAGGLLEMREAGALTIAQNEATCIVFGMPREAIARGAVDEVVSLDRLPAAILARAARVTGSAAGGRA